MKHKCDRQACFAPQSTNASYGLRASRSSARVRIYAPRLPSPNAWMRRCARLAASGELLPPPNLCCSFAQPAGTTGVCLGCLLASVLQPLAHAGFPRCLLASVLQAASRGDGSTTQVERTKLTRLIRAPRPAPPARGGARRGAPRYAEAHPEASSDLELVQSLWIQEVPTK